MEGEIIGETDKGLPPAPYRWVMLALLWLLYFTFGLVYSSTSPLVTPIIEDLAISYGQMGTVMGSWQFVYILAAVFAGVAIDRWGVRRALFFGMLVISLSAVLRGYASGFESLLLGVSLFGVGGPMISIGAPKTISLWFQGRDRGTAVGIYTTGPRMGSMLALCATNSLVMPILGYSWRWTFVCYGLFALAVALLWGFAAREIRFVKTAETPPINKVFLRLVKTYNIRIVLVSGLLSFTVMHGFTTWLPKLLESLGMTPKMAGFGAAVPLLAGIPGTLIIPRLTPPRARGWAVALLSILAGAAIFSVAVLPLPLMVGLILFGVASSSLIPLLMLMLMEIPEVGPAYMGAAGGIFFSVAEIGGFLGPFLVGCMVDLTGNFWVGMSSLAGLSLVIVFLIRLTRIDFPDG